MVHLKTPKMQGRQQPKLSFLSQVLGDRLHEPK